MAEDSNQSFFINLKAANIDGESLKAGHLGKDGWMEASSWSFHMSQSADFSVGSSAGTGTAAVGSFSFERIYDKASPLLFDRCTTGTPIKTAVFEAERTGAAGGKVVYFRLDFQDLCITSRSTTFDTNNRGGENISFAFAHVEMTHTQVLQDGSIGTRTKKIYDAKQNRAS